MSGSGIIGLVLSLMNYAALSAQTSDSVQYLSPEAFISIVRSYHPVARQANLAIDLAEAGLTSSRAGFDPVLTMTAERKTFDGKTYYDYFRPELKIPTWYGIEVKAGLENNMGDYLNPEISKGKSSYLGVSVPIGKNLVMDKRRAALRQARIFREQSRSERLLAINDLLYDAYTSYWNWVAAWASYEMVTEQLQLNSTRYAFVHTAFQQGDRPAIDTTEALAQLQSFQLAQGEAWMRFRGAGLELSNYMWMANDSPYYMPQGIRPDPTWVTRAVDTVKLPVLEELLVMARNTHPKLQVYDYKLKSLDIDKRLKFQDALPYVTLKGNILNKGYNVFDNASAAYYANNYKFGFDVAVPLRISQGRGDYRAAKIKIQTTSLDKSQTSLEIANKIKTGFNELATLQQQVRLAGELSQSYQRLLSGEELKFRSGESSLFLVNARESKALEARQKYAELRAKFFKSYFGLQWAAGQLR